MSTRCARLLAWFPLLLCFVSSILAEAAKPLRVATSILPLYTITVNLTEGSPVQVENLLPANASAHDYALTPRDAMKLGTAKFIIATGLGLEEWLVTEDANTRAKLIKAGAGLGDRAIRARTHGHGHDHHDWNPHFWLDPTLAAHAATNILKALRQADPANAALYQSNAVRYVKRLHKLDREIATALAPYKGTSIVTYHDAFPYFAQRYGLEIAGMIEEVAEVDPSPKHLRNLRKIIRDKHVRVIFTEKDAASPHARQMARDLSVELAPLDPLESGELTATAYEEGMRRNLEVLKKTFDASVP